VADDDAGRPPGAPAHADPGYPLHWEADVVLRDGGTAHVRPIRPDDADALQAFHVGQSARSTYLRFFAPLERLPEAELHRLTHVDHHDRVALVAVAFAFVLFRGPRREDDVLDLELELVS